MADTIPLPNLGTPFEYAGIQYLLAKEFGQQFFQLVDSRFRSHNVYSWFAQIQSRRAEDGQPVYEDPSDARFLLKEALYWNSEFRLVLPEILDDWDNFAKKLVKTLNSWSHQKFDPTAEAFLILLVQLESVAQGLKLDSLLTKLDELIVRTRALKNGVWLPSEEEVRVSSEAADFASTITKKIDEIKKRPPVGHEWIGKPGNRIIELSRATRDVYENGRSIRDQLGGEATEKIDAWLRYYPLGGRLRVDSDGAVLGFKQGIGYLVGWFGDDPDVIDLETRGFYIQREYEYAGNNIKDLDSGILLTSCAKEAVDWIFARLVQNRVPDYSALNITNYGDLTFTNENGEEFLIARLHKDVWFPGHLVPEQEI